MMNCLLKMMNFGRCVLALPVDNDRRNGHWQVSFLWKNPDFLVRNPDFPVKDPDSLLKNIEIRITQHNGTERERHRHIGNSLLTSDRFLTAFPTAVTVLDWFSADFDAQEDGKTLMAARFCWKSTHFILKNEGLHIQYDEYWRILCLVMICNRRCVWTLTAHALEAITACTANCNINANILLKSSIENAEIMSLKNGDFMLKNGHSFCNSRYHSVKSTDSGRSWSAPTPIAGAGCVSKHGEFRIKNEQFWIKSEELCIQNEKLCIKNAGFCRPGRASTSWPGGLCCSRAGGCALRT